MKKIAFLGASGEVTGSSFLLTTASDTKLLIDFGMFQGPEIVSDLNFEPLGFRPSEVEAVFLTHAHLDHCGRLPLLVFTAFQGKIYMTAPTLALIDVVLHDSAKIAQENLEHPPLYGVDEVEKVLRMVEVIEYDQEFEVNGAKVVFKDAGHILGSASIVFTDSKDGMKTVFSGDLGNSPEDIVRPTEYIDNADVVVMEATYGDKNHPDEDPTQILMDEILAIQNRSGVLLIPAFSLERTQELLHRINHLKRDKKISEDIPVFMDSPMGIRATLIFKDFKSFYNDELHEHTDDPFDFPGLVVTQDARDSKEIIKAMDPKVIIAGSGMMSGGRIMHHAAHYLSHDTTRLLFVGYQAEETMGRKILEGARQVVINDKQIKIKAQIKEVFSMSSHADQEQLLKWLGHIKGVKKVFIVHGDTPQREAFALKVKGDLQLYDVTLPQNTQEIEL